MRAHRLLSRPALAALLALAACDDNGITPQDRVAEIRVLPAQVEVVVGDTVRLSATALGTDSQPVSGATPTWEPGDPAIATVDAAGLVRGEAVGEADVLARVGPRTGIARVRVVPPPPYALRWSAWEPRVVDPAADSVTLVVAVNRVPARLVARRAGFPDLALQRGADGHFRARFAVADLLRSYVPGRGHRVVGQLLFDPESDGLVFNLVVNVRDPDQPTVPVQQLAADVQIAPHVINIRWDDLYLGRSVPPEVLRRMYAFLGDDYDFVAAVEQVSSIQNRFYVTVRNDVRGIGAALVDRGAQYGSPRRLQGTIQYPIDSYFDLAETASIHEIGHRWLRFVRTHPSLEAGGAHWPISTAAYGIMGVSIGGAGPGGDFPYRLEERPDGTWAVRRVAPARAFNDLELYLMGLAPAGEVGEHVFFRNQDQHAQLRDGGVLQGPVERLRAADLIARLGPREPAAGAAQKDFRLATVVLSRGRLLTQTEMDFFDHMAARGEADRELPYSSGFVSGITWPFRLATDGRATLTTRLR